MMFLTEIGGQAQLATSPAEVVKVREAILF
jgi:hypothetical protein